jgi:hypothetical protein
MAQHGGTAHRPAEHGHEGITGGTQPSHRRGHIVDLVGAGRTQPTRTPVPTEVRRQYAEAAGHEVPADPPHVDVAGRTGEAVRHDEADATIGPRPVLRRQRHAV